MDRLTVKPYEEKNGVSQTKTKGKHNLDVIQGGNGAIEAALTEIPHHPKASRETSQYQEHGFCDPVGHRKFINVTDGRPFALRQVAYLQR
ncbi:MAG: hypothetical protein CM15mP49_26430 [Actinomycetota bacterium]|nr:MAG: hypothetical protein CM15mP49_26430 [Actinomycetota bacterium]